MRAFVVTASPPLKAAHFVALQLNNGPIQAAGVGTAADLWHIPPSLCRARPPHGRLRATRPRGRGGADGRSPCGRRARCVATRWAAARDTGDACPPPLPPPGDADDAFGDGPLHGDDPDTGDEPPVDPHGAEVVTQQLQEFVAQVSAPVLCVPLPHVSQCSDARLGDAVAPPN